MSDIYDRASEFEEAARQEALAIQACKSGLAGKTVNDSATQCAVCEDLIPEDRRKGIPGVTTCVPCQVELERALGKIHQ